jgi:hypothetical protein
VEVFFNKAGINLIWCTRRICFPVNAEFRYALFLVSAQWDGAICGVCYKI